MTDQPDDDRVPRRVDTDLTDLIPADWHDQQVWVTSYRAYRLRESELVTTKPFDLLDVRGQVVWGGAPHLNYTQSMEPQVDGSVVVRQEVEGFQHAPDGPYLILMTRTGGTATPTNEEGVRSRLRSVLALLRLALGPNIAAEPLGELTIYPDSGEVTVSRPSDRPLSIRLPTCPWTAFG